MNTPLSKNKERIMQKNCIFCKSKFKPPIFSPRENTCFSCNSISSVIYSVIDSIKYFSGYSKQSKKYWIEQFAKINR